MAQSTTGVVHVDTRPQHLVNTFDPDEAIGSSIDVLSRQEIDRVYSPHILQESLSAGYGPITYRNNSELRMAAWHWNPNGVWSNAREQSGYFTGSTGLGEPIRYILSYPLPHRGFSTSGDRPLQGPHLTYWKSNPYLTSKFTGEGDELHPQWVVVDLQDSVPVNTIQIDWANPYAKFYSVEYWVGTNALDFDGGPKGEWKVFPGGNITNGAGGKVTLKLGPQPVSARYLRIWMTRSSNTCDEHGAADVRNCVGYAIAGIRAGTNGQDGAFTKAGSGGSKDATFTSSSIDPWHEASDVEASGRYQHSGFDLFFTSGLTNNLPALVPVTMLYGTPEDAAAQIAYLEKRGYPIRGIEMGEEPDGKHALPEDYGALYIEWTNAIRKVDPKVKLGGPIFEGVNEDITVWPDAKGRTSWMGRFIDYLKSHGHLDDLAFVAFEHYPMEPCSIDWKSLYKEPQLVKHILDVWRADGVPKEVPLIIDESHIAAQLTGPMSTIYAGLWLADSIGSFFEGGGATYFHSPIQPQTVQNSCLGWASWSNFVSDHEDNISGYTSLYFAGQMINREWVQHRSGVHRMFPSASDVKDDAGNTLVTSYAVHRPDGNWSLLLVNRDENNPHTVKIVFEGEGKDAATFATGVSGITFGSEQYVWKNMGTASHADPDHPPVALAAADGSRDTFTLPKASISVVRGRITGIKH